MFDNANILEIWDENEDITDDLEPQLPCASDLQPEDISTEASALVNWIISCYFHFCKVFYKLSDKVMGLLIHFFHILFVILGKFSSVCKTLVDYFQNPFMLCIINLLEVLL